MDKVNGGSLLSTLARDADCEGSAGRQLNDESRISKEELAAYIGDLLLQLRGLALKAGDAALAERLLAAYDAVRGKENGSQFRDD